MKREIVLYPAAEHTREFIDVDPNGSVYGGSPQIALWQAWKQGWTESHGAGDIPPTEDVAGWTLSAVNISLYAAASVLFDQAPTLALFTKLTFEMLADYGQGKPNNWFFPPDNAFGPRIQFRLRDRAGTGWHYSPVSEIGVDIDENATNLNFNTGTGYTGPASLSWVLFSHPEGGPFTLNDMNHLAAGVHLSFAAPVWDAGKFNRVRILAYRIRVELQDLGGYVRSVRHNASTTLRLLRRARNTIAYTVPITDQPKPIGDYVHFASREQEWGDQALERNSGQIVQRVYWPEAKRIDDIAFDLHDYSAEAWAAFMLPISWTPELSGLAYLDQGGEFVIDRAQDGWSLRPGDGAALRVLEDYPILSDQGLACHKGGEESACLYGQNFTTGWTSTDVTGGLTFAVETGSVTADELGYQVSTRFTFGGTPGTGGKKQEFSLTSGDVVNIRARVRNLTVDTPGSKFLEVAFHDNSGNYWNEATRTWDASPVYNAIDASGAFGETIFDQVPISNTETHTLKIGRFSSAIAQATFVVGLADLFIGGDGTGMPLLNLGVTSTRVGDIFEMDNLAPYTFLYRSRGQMIVEWRPWWRAEELVADAVKAIWYAGDSTDAYYDRFDFVAKDGPTADLLRFTRYDTGGTQTFDLEMLDSNGDPLDLTRAHVVRTWVRWLDAAGFKDRGPYEVAIGYAVYDLSGNLIVQREGATVFDPPDSLLEGYVLIGSDAVEALDGWARTFEAKSNPVTGDEAIWSR